MPPKKKGVGPPKAKASSTTMPAKPAPPIPETVTTNRGREIETTAALARPRRAIAAPVQAAAATPSTKKVAAKKTAPATKKGAACPAEAAVPAKRGPGRPPKAKAATSPAPATEATTTKKGTRGRPANTTAETTENRASAPKKRGPPAAVKAEAEAENHDEDEDDEQPAAKKARGKTTVKEVSVPARPALKPILKNGKKASPALAPAVSPEVTAPPKKRGRPPTGGQTTKISADDGAAADQLEEELVDTAEAEDDGGDSGKNFWLLKAEQVDRFESTGGGESVNTKFTIDDLRAKTKPEAWEGIRNPQARNNMRAMKVGDEAFFYASNGKKPGIVGIMEIVKEHEADPTAFDENSLYYEAKNPGTLDEPKWSLVHVEFRKKLTAPVFLPELKKYAKANGPLADMQEMKGGRLSVSKVSQKEWDFIVNDLIEGYEDEEMAEAAAIGGTGDENENDLPMADAPGLTADALAALPAFKTTEADMPTTDDVFPAETNPTSVPASRVASRKASRAPSVAGSRKGPKSAAGSRQASLAPEIMPSTEPGAEASRPASAGSLASGRARSRGRGRTPRSRAGSAAHSVKGKSNSPAPMAAVQEEEMEVEQTTTTAA